MVQPTASREFGPEEVGLALRNHGMLLEGLRYDVTPVGMHYLLIHFDVPFLDPGTYALAVGGRVRNPLRLTLEDVRRRPALTIPVTMECSGNGRAHLSPRPISAPWREEAVGCAEWTGTPLGPILEEGGVLDDAVENVFAGHDRGIDDGVEHDYERSMPVEEAMRDEVLLAWGMNGYPLPPQHGAPLRLIVPEWYGMASVKWLKSITAVTEPFDGVQQTSKYLYKSDADDPGLPITSKKPHALMAPPSIPDYLSRRRHVRPGPVTVEGRGPASRSSASSSAPTAASPGTTPTSASRSAPTRGSAGPTSGTRPPASTSCASAPQTRPARRSPLAPKGPGTTAATGSTSCSACV